jgi:hypothetical protein
MANPRYQHATILLRNGKVLVAGGSTSNQAELFDPVAGTFSATAGNMKAIRSASTMTLLSNGTVLIVGGENPGGVLASAEIFDPAANTFNFTTGSMTAGRSQHTATLLPNGKVLIVGGQDAGGTPLAHSELYDPGTGTFSGTGDLATARSYHTATLLPNGKVLVTGGNGGVVFPTDAELYDPTTSLFSAAPGNMSSARIAHTATLLPNGKVLIAGGEDPATGTLDTAEVFDPASGLFSPTVSPMNAFREYHRATLLPNGKILLTGGFDSGLFSAIADVELYDCTTNTFSATASMKVPRYAHDAVLLPDDRVLITGGIDPSFSPVASAELFYPDIESQLVPLVTDQTPMALSNTFSSNAGGGVLNQAGDYAFNSVNMALFLRRAGAAAPSYVFQTTDEAPGVPGSRADLIVGQKLNSSGLLAFGCQCATSAGISQGGIFTYDGASYHKIVFGSDTAPGTGGATYGLNIALVGLNDLGDVAFTAPLTYYPAPAKTTLFIAPGGGAPMRIAGVGDAAAGMSHGETLSSLTVDGFNNQGEVLFYANISGGAGGSGLFIGTVAGGVRKVVANGDPMPGGGTFSPASGYLNNPGAVLFYANSALWISSPTAVISKTVASGDAAPISLGGTFSSTPGAIGFNDAGEFTFNANIAGSAVTTYGLFRFNPINGIEVVAYQNESAPGIAGEKFSTSFSAVSINNAGMVSFRGTLTGGPVPYGIFQQTGGSSPSLVVYDGEPTSLPGGGTYSLSSSTFTQTLDSGAVYFWSYPVGGTANYAEFLVSGGSALTLMSTADSLPAGAKVSIRVFGPFIAGNYIGLSTQRNGGQTSLAIHNMLTHQTVVVATDGDSAPAGVGGRMTGFSSSFGPYVNASGTAVFSASISGGPNNGTTAIFMRAWGGALTKVVAAGDIDPATGRTFSSISLETLFNSLLNDAGQVVFRATLKGASPSPSGIFVVTPGFAPVKVALTGDAAPGGGTFQSFTWFGLNQAGQVPFVANVQVGSTQPKGVFIGAPGTPPAKVAVAGDPGPGGSTFLDFLYPGFNNLGEVAFMATLNGGAGGGVFVGSATGPPTPLALNGSAAPAGGNFSITSARPDVLINDQHDVVFRAALTGGTSDSGYFLRRGTLGGLQAPLLQGQPAAGTSGVFATFPSSLNNVPGEFFKLAPTGDMIIYNPYIPAGGQSTYGLWRVKPDNSVELILVRGQTSSQFGGGTIVITIAQGGAVNNAGYYPFTVYVSGGNFASGIVLYIPIW